MISIRFAAVTALIALSAAAAIAQGPISSNMSLLANVNEYNSYNDCWGFVGNNGDEYAVIGTNGGTAFYRITDPQNPVNVGFISGPWSSWRDIKDYRHPGTGDHYVYMGSEGGSGVQIVNVTDPDNPVFIKNYTGAFTTSHNIYLEQGTGKLYGCGTNTGGLNILDLTIDPENPIPVGSWGNKYIHDLYVLNDTAYVGCISAGQFRLLDVSNPANVTTLLTQSYSGSASHAAWIVEDNHDFLITVDEANNGHGRCWDISDPQTVTEVSSFKRGDFHYSVHNVIVKGSVAYFSYYMKGTRVVSFADPHNPVEIGFYDTTPLDTLGTYNGNWGVYPLLPSGTIISSDMIAGLYLTELDQFVGVDSNTDVVPPAIRLIGASPNPFNPVTRIGFSLSDRRDVDLSIYTPSGRLVQTLFHGSLPPGEHSVSWNGTDSGGGSAPSGVYLYRLEAGDYDDTKKLHLVR